MSSQLRISAKTLGELALQDFCPRCFWIKLHTGKLPFQIFPGIFNSIDSYTKKIVHCHFDDGKCNPPWLDGLGQLKGYKEPPHYSVFRIVDKGSNVILWGSPDGIFIKSDGSHVIVDYKTARYTGVQDNLMPMYQTQLNAYATIGEQCGLHPVSDLALIYMEPVTDGDTALYMGNQRGYGFDMGFSAAVHKVDLDPALVPALLSRARDLYELPAAPKGRQECKECVNLQNLISTALGRKM